MLAYVGFSQLALDRTTKPLKLVDECGNIWNCTLQFERKPDPHFKIGGGWNRMIKARGLQNGVRVIIGAPFVGMNEKIFFSVVHY